MPRNGYVQVSNMRFLCEQDGRPEQQLKAQLRPLLTDAPIVSRAYLALIEYDNNNMRSVALCLSAFGEPSMELMKSIGLLFSSCFHTSQHLDILVVNPQQESQLQKVCSPFYSRLHGARENRT